MEKTKLKIEEWRKRSGRRSCQTSFGGGSVALQKGRRTRVLGFVVNEKRTYCFCFLYFSFELKSILLNGILKINGKLVVNASKVGFLVNLPILNYNLVITKLYELSE